MNNQLSQIYGRGWAFPPRFTSDGVKMAVGAEDVRQSLWIILSTLPGERIMREDFGCDLNQFMFISISSSLLSDIEQHINDCILRYEPRAQVINIKFDTTNMKDGVVEVLVNYCLTGSVIQQQLSGRLEMLNGRALYL